jgi:hypothetical protein
MPYVNELEELFRMSMLPRVIYTWYNLHHDTDDLIELEKMS